MLKSTIVRVLAFAALFAYILPAAFGLAGFGSSFAFTGNFLSGATGLTAVAGSVLAALAVGAVYMACMFVVLFAWAVGTAPFKLTIAQRNDMWPWTTASFLLATMACLLGAASFAPWLGLSVVGWLPALIAGCLSIALMHFTMWNSSSSSESSPKA